MSRSDPVDSLIPSRVGIDPGITALALIVSTADGLVARLSDYSGDPQATRRWLLGWLMNRLSDWDAEGSVEPATTASFMALTVRRHSNGQLTLGEFTYGEAPAAPAEWRSVPTRQLAAHAVEALSR